MHRLILLALLAVPTWAIAQERATELGLGITGLGVDITGGSSLVSFQASQRYVSLGLYVSPSIAIEPATSISVLSGGGGSLAILSFALRVPVHTKPTWGRSGLYFAPGAALTILSADASGTGASASQFSIGLDVGTKISVVDAVSLKVAGSFGYGLATDTFDDVVSLGGQVGISVFFR